MILRSISIQKMERNAVSKYVRRNQLKNIDYRKEK